MFTKLLDCEPLHNDNLLKIISVSSDRSWLERCRAQNQKSENVLIVEAVMQRLEDLELTDSLKINAGGNTIEKRVAESLRVYRALLKHKHGRNQAAGYTEREIKKYGAKEALIRTVRRGKKTSGLTTLQSKNRLDCSYEQIAIDFASELPDDVVERAKATLAAFEENLVKDES